MLFFIRKSQSPSLFAIKFMSDKKSNGGYFVIFKKTINQKGVFPAGKGIFDMLALR